MVEKTGAKSEEVGHEHGHDDLINHGVFALLGMIEAGINPWEEYVEDRRECLACQLRGALTEEEVSESKVGFVGSLFDGEKNEKRGRAGLFLKGLQRNAAFSEVVRVFDGEVAENKVFQQSAFFQHEGIQRDFAERLMRFNGDIDRKIKTLERKVVNINPRGKKFSANWQHNVRKACYYVFFIHYGSKRGGEVSQDDGKALDYVYHVIDAAFSSLAARGRFFDEKALIAAILHDTKEDYSKGIFGLLVSDDMKMMKKVSDGGLTKFDKLDKWDLSGRTEKLRNADGKIIECMDMFESELERDSGDLFEGEYGVRKLVKLVTKMSEDRNESILYMWEEILKNKDIRVLISALKGFLIKFGGDRLSNIKTNRAGGLEGKRKTKADVVEDETVFISQEVNESLGQISLADWFLDYIDLFNPTELRKMKAAALEAERLEALGGKGESGRRRAGKSGGASRLSELSVGELARREAEARKVKSLIEVFERFFHQELKRELGWDDLRVGRDYLVQFRPVGWRHQKKELLEAERKRGSFSTGLRNYLFVYGNSDDEEKNKAVSQAAARILTRTFSGAIDFEGRSGVVDCALGKLVLRDEEKGMSGCGNNFECSEGGEVSREFGDCIWRVFGNNIEAEAEILGAIHVAIFYPETEIGKRAIARIEKFVEGLRRDLFGVTAKYRALREQVKSLRNQMKNLDNVDRGDIGLQTAWSSVEEYVALFALSPFARRPYPVKVKINLPEPMSPIITKVNVQNPGCPWEALAHVHPNYLFFKDCEWKLIQDDEETVYEFDMKGGTYDIREIPDFVVDRLGDLLNIWHERREYLVADNEDNLAPSLLEEQKAA